MKQTYGQRQCRKKGMESARKAKKEALKRRKKA